MRNTPPRTLLLCCLLPITGFTGCSNGVSSSVEEDDRAGGDDAGSRGDGTAGDQDNGSGDDGSLTGDNGPLPPVGEAQLDVCEEWASVFPNSAFAVTDDDRGNLQALLDQHGVLALAPGNYRDGGPNHIDLHSNQALLSLGSSRVPDIVVKAGTSHAKIRGLEEFTLSFEGGDASRYNCFMKLKRVIARVQNATVERNLFLYMAESNLAVDTSASGAFRDNRIIKLNTHGGARTVDLVGDSARHSGGNVFLLADSQSLPGSVVTMAGQSDVTFVGVNSEGYNGMGSDPDPSLFDATNIGEFRVWHTTGVTRAPASSPGFDLDAEKVFLHDAHAADENPQVRTAGALEALVSWRNDWQPGDFDFNGGTGPRFFIQDRGNNDVAVRVGTDEITSPPGENDALVALLRDSARSGEAWPLPAFVEPGSGTGGSWASDRNGKPDERAALQQMIDDGTARLEARTYYIGGPLVLHSGDSIYGAGMDKTTIVALNAGVDLVSIEWGNPGGCNATTGSFAIAELTLQGGRVGIRSTTPGVQVNQAVVSHVAIRNMANEGLLIDGAYGWDNNFFDHVSFIDCGAGVRQNGHEKPGDSCYGIGEWSTMSYVDKTVFFRNQFIRNGSGIVLHPSRGNYLDAVVESYFDGNDGVAVEGNSALQGFVVASSVFIDNDANPVVSGPIAVVNSTFMADRGQSMIGPGVDAEGCTFLAGSATNATIFGNVTPGDVRDANYTNVSNSRSELRVGALDDSVPVTGILLNNTYPVDEPRNGFMTAIAYRTQGSPQTGDDSRSVYTLLNGEANPHSQLLFGVPWR